MGGMIAQNVAARWPERVVSLTSIMSTTGRRNLPQPTWRAKRALLQKPARKGDTEGAIHRMVNVMQHICSRTYPPNDARLREACTRHVMRSHHPAGGTRQLMAIIASGDRTNVIRQIKAPSLILHGEEDPLVPIAAGLDTAKAIRDGGGTVEVKIIKGMGHDLPVPLLPTLADAISEHCRKNM
jgi:proline iminopeptidase